jgi:hypothetical protein
MQATLRILLLLSIVCSISSRVASQAPFTEESPLAANLRESVFRYMFDHYKYGASVSVYCIAAERPLPENFLSRFAGGNPRVIWSSDCSRNILGGVKEIKTGRRGLLMSINSINWSKGDEVEVNVESYSDGLAANWNKLTVVYKDRNWIVKKDLPTGQS